MGDRDSHWKDYREEEFKEFITGLCKLARRNNFSVWVGGQNKAFSVVISADWSKRMISEKPPCHSVGFGVRMAPKRGYRYCYAEDVHGSPSRISLSSYDSVIASTVNGALEFVASKMDFYIKQFGEPDKEAVYFTSRLDKISEKGRQQLIGEIMKMIDWDQGKIEQWSM